MNYGVRVGLVRTFYFQLLIVVAGLVSGLSSKARGREIVDTKLQYFISMSDSAIYFCNYPKALVYIDSALGLPSKSRKEVGLVLLKKSFVLQVKSEYSEALKTLYEAQRNYEKDNNLSGLAEVYIHIGAIHQNLGDYKKATDFYNYSLNIYKKLDMKPEMARCYNNFGSLAEDMNKPSKALVFHRESAEIWKSIHEKGWEGVSYMHLGVCHSLIGQTDSAVYFLESSSRYLKSCGDNSTLVLVYNLLGNVYRKAGKTGEAKKCCERGLQLSKKLGLVRYQAKSCECLYLLNETLGKTSLAFFYHKQFVRLRDSIFNEQKSKEITRIEMNFGFQQRQLADSLEQVKLNHREELKFGENIAREKETRNISIFAGIMILFIAGGLWNRLQFLRRSRKLLSGERDKLENLLLKILPAEIVEELKTKGKSEGREHEDVSVLFIDVKSFTEVAQQMTPKELVAEINTCFETFDTIIEAHGLEKIKTIGDSYMAAAGVPAPRNDGAKQMILATLAIQQFLLKRKIERDGLGLPSFEMRAGIHSGPVVAGVVGNNKFQYDIWGDTVNTASRLETAGEAGMVNISATTYAHVKDDGQFTFEYRGAIQAKGKGLMEMYFVGLAI